MGRKTSCCRARIEKTLSQCQQQVASPEPNCQFASDLCYHSNIRSSSAESWTHQAAVYSQARSVTALDLGGRCRI